MIIINPEDWEFDDSDAIKEVYVVLEEVLTEDAVLYMKDGKWFINGQTDTVSGNENVPQNG